MIYRFGMFTLDDEHYELRRGSSVVPLPRKGFDLLHHLLVHAGRVVPKEEIFERIWPSIAVSENVLPVTIRTIRRAIADEAGVTLRTVRGRGYTIAAPVTAGDSEPKPAPAAAPAQGRSFVGRQQLMQTLQTELMVVSGGNGQVLLIHGDAGMGKSVVIQQFARWAAIHSPFVFQVCCRGTTGAPAYWPLIQVMSQAERALRTAHESDPVADEVADLGRARASLEELVDPRLNRNLSPAEVRFRFTRSFLRLLQQLTADHSVVLLFDDLHAADDDSLQVIDAIVREIAAERVLVVGTHCPSEIVRGGDSSYLLAKLAQAAHVEQIALRGLDLAAVEQFLREESGVEPPEGLARALLEKTEGNPFFLRETLRWLMQAGPIDATLDASEIGLPTTVRDVILRRLDGLSDPCNQLLGWAAVAGRSFTVPLLEQVTGLPSDAVLQQLSAAEHARIISSRDPSGTARPPGEYGFAHTLIGETLYQEISAAERVRRHRAVAEALELLSGRSAHERIDELAHHFFQAAPAGDIERATYYAEQATERALSVCAYDDAIEHQRNRLRAEELRAPRDDARYCAALIGLGDALAKGGRYADAEQTYLRAADLARELDDGALFARAALGVAGDPFRLVGPEGKEDPARASSAAMLEEAQARLPEDSDAILRCRVFAASARLPSHPLDRRAELAGAAIELARDARSGEALFDALMARLEVLVAPEQITQRLSLAHEAVDLARTMDARPRLSQAYTARVPLLFVVGDMAAADRDIEALAQLARELRLPAYSYAVARFRMCRAAGSGELEQARVLLDDVMRLGRQAGDPRISWIVGAIGLFLFSVEGSTESISRGLTTLVSQQHMEGPTADAFAAHFCMMVGDRKGCAARFDKAAAIGFDTYPRTEDWLWNLALLADVCVYLGDRARSAQLYALLKPYAHLNVVNRLWHYRGSLASVLGRLALVQGDLDSARAHLEHAIEFNRKLGASVTVLINRYFHASVLDLGSPKDRRDARAARKEVLAEASRRDLRALFERLIPGYRPA